MILVNWQMNRDMFATHDRRKKEEFTCAGRDWCKQCPLLVHDGSHKYCLLHDSFSD